MMSFCRVGTLRCGVRAAFSGAIFTGGRSTADLRAVIAVPAPLARSIVPTTFGTALILLFALCTQFVRGEGLTWPANQMLPTFSKPASVLDCIDVSSCTGAEVDLFASIEGIVNRAQPQIICVSRGDGEGAFTWVDLHNLNYNVTNGYNCILKYRSSLTGLVVTDPNEPDTVNLATTMAGINNELICDPGLLGTLTNAPYNLAVKDDLRGRFSYRNDVYAWLYTNY